MKIQAVNINNISDEQAKSLFSKVKFLSSQTQENVNRFKRQQDSFRLITGQLLIRSYLIKNRGYENNQIVFEKNKYGKPYLINNDIFHFNLSHSGHWVVLATNENSPIGVDVEKIHPISFDIAKKFFTHQEYKAITTAKSQAQQLNTFYTFWTLKESYIKAHGKGMHIPLNSFNINIENINITVEKEGKIENETYFNLYEIDENYKLALCGFEKPLTSKVELIGLDDLLIDFDIVL